MTRGTTFLATTGLTEFWAKDRRILCLGPWCLRHDRRSEWSALDYSVLPNPWTDRPRFYRCARDLEERFERFLGVLSHHLNETHEVRFSRRYWRILLGPWLVHYIHQLFDRYIRIVEAVQKHGPLTSFLLDSRDYRIPRLHVEFMDAMLKDSQNLQVMSQMLVVMGCTWPTRRLQGGTHGGPARGESTIVGLPPASPIPPGGAAVRAVDLALHGLGFNPDRIDRRSRRLGYRAAALELSDCAERSAPAAILDEKRNRLAHLLRPKDEFDRILNGLLPGNFPSLYLEGYTHARRLAVGAFPVRPRLIAATVGWHHDETFKLFAAEQAENGTVLVAGQHGGCYGTHRYLPGERHERRLADAYVSWGWGGGRKGQLDLSSPSLSLLAVKSGSVPAQAARKNLMILAPHYPYLVRFHSEPVGVAQEELFEWESRFLGRLPTPLRRDLSIRVHPSDRRHGPPTRDRLESRFGRLRWDRDEDFVESLIRSRLVVSDYPGTNGLQALVCDVPTIFFWDFSFSDAAPGAEPFLVGLRTAGILQSTPEEAAAHVARIWKDPSGWWRAGSVQKARREFVNRFGRVNRRWQSEWARGLIRALQSRGNGPRRTFPAPAGPIRN